ncbi:MAG: twin-arginine translocase subunit TatC [Chitinophagales bacterium]|nr:twin-arginine translocase subunit TatC [Chitinophagales bacterium]
MALPFRKKQEEPKAEMTFVDHLEELRWHVIRSVLAVFFMGGVIFVYRDWIFDNIIFGPVNPDFVSYKFFCDLSHWLHLGDALCMPPVSVSMQTTTFGGQFVSSITVAIVGGFIIAFPYVFWEFWRFVKPALKDNELKGTRFVIFWVTFFFLLGISFGYFVLGPFTFNFLANFNIGTRHFLETKPTLNDFLDNLINILVGCGIAFELPVLAYAFTKIGLITPMFLKESRRYAIVIILVVAAIITPSPDWISQLLVFIPLFLLYQLSILVSARVYKEEEKKMEEWS